MTSILQTLALSVQEQPRFHRKGVVTAVAPEQVIASGLGDAGLGDRVLITHGGRDILGEIVANDRTLAKIACYAPIDGLAPGAEVLLASNYHLRPSSQWLGRIVDPFGSPLDGKGPLPKGEETFPSRRLAPPAVMRQPIGRKLTTGIHAIDIFTPLCEGQRIGLFAGSGVGKTVLMNMITARASPDAFVFAMVGERGREVNAFIENLGEDARARTCTVVATSDQTALCRREAAYAATAVAEALSAEGLHVMLIMDSVTRFANAGREIGLAAGEPPSVRGYPPSIFAELPRLLERAGPGIKGHGPITALYTVLVEGSDHDEPVSDNVRGILDGHIVMSRAIAERGRLPAIDVLKSVSRTLPEAHSDAENRLMLDARSLLAAYQDVYEVVRLGAYEAGSNAQTDEAIRLSPLVENLLKQSPRTPSLDDPFAALQQIIAPQADVAE